MGEAGVEHELERVDVKHDDEQQGAIEDHGIRVLQSVAPEEKIVLIPDPEEHTKAAGERGKSAHQIHQLRVTLRHFERDDEQGEREGEDRVAKRLEAGNIVSSSREHERDITGGGLLESGKKSSERRESRSARCGLDSPRVFSILDQALR